MSIQAVLTNLLDGYNPSIIFAVAGILLLLWQKLSVKMDPREPPLRKPKIPYIGHIIGILKDHMTYYDQMNTEKEMPCCTLPMINSKIYVLNSYPLIQAAYRNKSLSFEPFITETAKTMLQLSDEIMVTILAPPVDKELGFIGDFVKGIHSSMGNEHLHKMNAYALNDIAYTINGLGVGESLELDSLYLWIRDMLSMATCTALLGSHSPMKDDPSLIQSLWDFEAAMVPLSQLKYGGLLFRRAARGRTAIQNALIEYYHAQHDLEPDVSQLVKVRARGYRKYGFGATETGKFELALVHVSTANAVPTLFWLILFIFSEVSLVEELRAEVENIIQECVIDITKFESHCPLLGSVYKECLRLINAQLGTRRVMADTTISDGNQTYLLLKGYDLQIASGTSHLSPIWGASPQTFNPKRFLFQTTPGYKMSKEERERAKAFIPFGGGHHLCPGRQFALAEILGVVSVLLVGFEVKGRDGGILQRVELPRARLGNAVAKPEKGKGLEVGAGLSRRKGWEGTGFRFSGVAVV